MFNRRFVAVPPLGMCDSDVALSVSRRGGEKGGAAAGDYIAASRGAFAPLFSSVSSSVHRKVFSVAGRHGWILESPQLPFEICWSWFFQKPGGACAGCKLSDFATKKL